MALKETIKEFPKLIRILNFSLKPNFASRENSQTLPIGLTRCIMDQILPSREARQADLLHIQTMSSPSRDSWRAIRIMRFLTFR